MTEKFVTLPREVVEQVLKAAEAFHSHYKRNIFSGCVPSEELYFSAARASLRAALEQPQGEQKAFAWISPRALEWGTRQSEKVVKLTCKAQPEYDFTEPLYTHPQPNLKPLTDEQIAAATGVKPGTPMWLVAVAFTRAIEAAHNIK